MRFRQDDVVRLIAVTVCLLVAGCVPGDRFHSSYIEVSFPEMTKERVFPLVLDAGFARGYRRGGQWKVGGRSLSDACGQARDNWSACRERFMENAIWAEEKEQIGEEAIRFWFDIVNPEGWIMFEPRVKIENVAGGCRVEFDFVEFATPLRPQVKAEFYALKQLLIERYASMVTTRHEP